MTADPSHTQLAEQVAELKKELAHCHHEFGLLAFTRNSLVAELKKCRDGSMLIHKAADEMGRQIAALKGELAEARKLLGAASQALRSHQYGNLRGIFARGIAETIDAWIKAKAALAGAEGKAPK